MICRDYQLTVDKVFSYAQQIALELVFADENPKTRWIRKSLREGS